MENRRQDRLYTALLAHDISNFNQTMRGYLEMLLDEQMGELTDEQGRALTTCLRQCQRVESLIDGIRTLQELADETPAPEPTDLDRAVQDAIAAVQSELADRDIRVRFTPGGRRVLAEPQLSSLFRQLIGNAARHNDCEIVEVDLALTPLEGDPPMWEISVTDNGNGVPPAKREQLFNRLASGQIHGSGLGLSVARTLLRRWGGEIVLSESADAQGATFLVTLRRA